MEGINGHGVLAISRVVAVITAHISRNEGAENYRDLEKERVVLSKSNFKTILR